MFAEISGVYFISEIVNQKINDKVMLSIGNGVRPISYLLIFNFVYLFFGTLYLDKFKGTKKYKNTMLDVNMNRVYSIIVIIFVISLIYVTTRYIFYSDFPIFAFIKGIDDINLRNVAFNYGSNTSISYIFLPSVNSQFYRVLLPVTFFIGLYYYQNHNQTSNVKVFLTVSLLVILILNLGTFKRTPILYLATWLILYQYMYVNSLVVLKKIFISFVIVLGILFVITSLTYGNSYKGDYILPLVSRFILGEAKGEFFALEHFGTTLDYMYFDIFTVYLQKVLGMDVITFSELWKTLIGGTRGYTSIGIVAELIVSFGYLSVFYFMFFSVAILNLDILFKKYSCTIYRPIIAGLITFISFMMIKGFFSQLFTGGVIVLLAVGLIIKFNIKGNKCINSHRT